MKVCSKCGVEKKIEEFNKQKQNKDGLHNFCRACRALISRTMFARNKTMNQARWPYDDTIKHCPQCNEDLPRSVDFWYVNPNTKDGLSGVCMDCDKLRKIKSAAIKQGGIINFPIPFTGKQMRELKLKQDLLCYVCRLPENGTKLNFDHNHTSGKARGYAHQHCNMGMLRWLDYLWNNHPEKHKWILSNPHYKELLFNPPAKYLYENSSGLLEDACGASPV